MADNSIIGDLGDFSTIKPLGELRFRTRVARVHKQPVSLSQICATNHKCVQAAQYIQNECFSNNASSDTVCNADMYVGEIRKFCRLPEESQSLMQVAMTQLMYCTLAFSLVNP